MHARHHHLVRIQFTAAGIGVLALIAIGSLSLPRVPVVGPMLASAGLWRPPAPTAETLAMSRFQSAIDQRRPEIDQLPQSASSTEGGSVAKSVPILLYHGFDITSEQATSTGSVRYDDFIAHMRALAENGWRTVSLADFYAFIRGERSLPAKSFLLTFDDGRKDSFYLADPILEKTGFTAIMFAITVHLDNTTNPYYLRTREYQQMHASGRWEIQSHGHDDHDEEVIDASGRTGHFVSNPLWLPDQGRVETELEYRSRLHDDFTRARKILEDVFGVEVYTYAYPFGDYGQPSAQNDGSTKALVLEETRKVYDLAFYQVGIDGTAPNQNIPQVDPFLAKRITVQPGWGAQDVLDVLRSGSLKSVPYADALRYPRDWRPVWGMVTSTNDGVVTLSAKPDGTGAMVLLNGTERISGEIIRATVQSLKGESFSLVAAYQDEQNYVTCDYGPNTITLRMVRDGMETRRQWWSRIPFPAFSKSRPRVRIGIDVSHRGPACLLHDDVVVAFRRPVPLSAGSIGFKTWSSSLDGGALALHGVDVQNAP